MADNGLQIGFHCARGTGEVKVTGNNQDGVRVTWTGRADDNGFALTKDWWFQGQVDITWVDSNGTTQVKSVNVPKSGPAVYDVSC